MSSPTQFEVNPVIAFCANIGSLLSTSEARKRTKFIGGWGKPGPRLNIKTVLSTYGDFHVKDKTAVLSLTWESPYLVRPSFLLRRPPGVQVSLYIRCTDSYVVRHYYSQALQLIVLAVFGAVD